MLMEAGRDTGAMLFLDKSLGALREAYLRQVVAGDSPPDDFWRTGEARVVEEVKRRFFAPHVKKAVQSDKEFDEHSQKLVEKAIWLAHEKLKAIPFVGQPEHADNG